ncbi:MAG: MFS transporter [Candidatus Anstonellaceae archaeon]
MSGNISKMYAVSFLRSLTFFGAIAVPFFLDRGKLNYASIFLLESAFSLSIVLAEVPTGVFADKFGRRLSLVSGFLLTAFGILVFLSKPDFLVFLVAEIIWGVGAAFLSGADRALVFDSLKEMKSEKKAKEVFARISITETAGIVLALPAGSYLAGLRIMPYPDALLLPFALTIIPFLLGAIVVFLMKEPKRQKPAENFLVAGLKGINTLREKPSLRSLALDMTMISMLGFFMFWFYQSLLREYSIDITYWGLVGAGFNALAMVLLWKLPMLEKIFGARRLLYFSALTIGLLYLAVGFIQSFIIALVAIFAITSLRPLRQPLFEHYINFQIGSRERATVLSSISLLERLGLVIMYPVVGFLADISLQLAFLFLGSLTIIFALLLRSSENAFEKGG